MLLFDFVVAYSKTLLKKDTEVTYCCNASSWSLEIIDIYQIGIVPTEMVLEVEARNGESVKQTE